MSAVKQAVTASALSLVVASCTARGNPSAPSAPSGPPAVSSPAANALVVFTDPQTGLSTSDVRDAQDHIV
jgi:hypothetical protein